MVSKGTKKGIITAGVGIGGFLGGIAVGHLIVPAVAEIVTVPNWAKDYINRIELQSGGETLKKEYVGEYSYLPNPWEGHTWVFRGQTDNRVKATVTVERKHLDGASDFGYQIASMGMGIDIYLDGQHKQTIPKAQWTGNWGLHTGYCTGYEWGVTEYE